MDKLTINLTPHPIRVVGENGYEITYPPSGQVLRLVETETLLHTDAEGIRFVRKCYGLPDINFIQAGKTYIVSLIVIPYLKGITGDFIAPDTGPKSVVRDSEGKIVGVKGFIVP